MLFSYYVTVLTMHVCFVNRLLAYGRDLIRKEVYCIVFVEANSVLKNA